MMSQSIPGELTMERLLNDIGFNIVDYLRARNIHPVYNMPKGVTTGEIEIWESSNHPYKLPEDFKNFLTLTNGLSIKYDVNHIGELMPLGRMHLNGLSEIKPVDFDEEDLSIKTLKGSDILPFSLDWDPNAGVLALFYIDKPYKPQVWFQDLACTWHFVSGDFTSFFRIWLLHLGVPGWQYAFTDIGLDPITLQWLSLLAPVRKEIDVSNIGKSR